MLQPSEMWEWVRALSMSPRASASRAYSRDKMHKNTTWHHFSN